MAASPPVTTSLPPIVGGGLALVVLAAIFIPLTILSVVLRISSKLMTKKPMQWNDHFAIVACVLAVANAVAIVLAVVLGGVGHQQLEVLPELEVLLQITFSLALLWTFANFFVKLSILHFYITIFQRRWFIIAAYITMALSVLYCLENTLQLLLICRPVAANWDPTIPGAVCSTAEAPYLSSAIIHMSIDIIIVALPMPVLWGLQMATMRKIQLSLIFGIGIVICALSAVRISAITSLNYQNFSYSVVDDGVYSVLEPCLGTINCCLPILQPVVSRVTSSRIFSSLRSTFTRSSKGDSTFDRTFPSNGHARKLESSGEHDYPLTHVRADEESGRMQKDNRDIEVTTSFSMQSRSRDGREMTF